MKTYEEFFFFFIEMTSIFDIRNLQISLLNVIIYIKVVGREPLRSELAEKKPDSADPIWGIKNGVPGFLKILINIVV